MRLRLFIPTVKHVKGLQVPVRTIYAKAVLCKGVGYQDSEKNNPFTPRRAAVLTKMTRYEFEKKTFKGISEEDLKIYLENKRSDYHGLLERHRKHYKCVDIITESLRKHGIETRVVHRFDFNSSLIDWADIIFTAGGDGTYLLAASKIRNNQKPVIGVNTDPSRSEGCLCLPKEEYSAMYFDKALRRILDGDFIWKWRQRIRITMSGQHANDEPVELHDQQLLYPEHRFTEHVYEHETCRHDVNTSENAKSPRVLPILALNEVFVGESLSSRVSYYEFKTDDKLWEKHKSSGVTVCTGTGSTSWFFHINHLSEQDVKQILSIADRLVPENIPVNDDKLIRDITSDFNHSLRFDPSEAKMAYTTRDPVINRVFKVPHPRGFAQRIEICSRMWDACLVIDGGSSFCFNDGAIATLEIKEEDSLRTIEFI